MNAFFILMALVSQQADYQVFPYTTIAKDYYGAGPWGGPSFVLSQDDIDNVDPDYMESGPSGGGAYVEFFFPLSSGDPQDIDFAENATYNVRFARGSSWDSITLWNPGEYEITVPSAPSSSWQDSIIVDSGLYTMHWRLANDNTLRIRLWAANTIDYAFAVIAASPQDLSPTTWGSVKSSF